MSLKICYIWVEKFRNFENFGFNLSSYEKFSFDRESFNLKKEMINNIPNDFYGENVSSVMGILGRNGSGKSNLLELVCKILKDGKTSITSEFLIIIREDKEYKCYHNFNGVIVFKSNFTLKTSNYSGRVENLKVIYFSNIYDERIQSFNSKISDLSANKRYAGRPSARKTTDFVKQLQFIRSEAFVPSEIPLPKEILVMPKYNTHNSSYWEKRLTSNSEFDKRLVLAFKSFYSSLKKSSSSKEKLYGFLIYSQIVEVLYLIQGLSLEADLFDDTLQKETKWLIEELEEISLTYKSKLAEANRWKDWCSNIIKHAFSFYDKSNRSYKKIKFIESNIKLLDDFDEFIETKNIKTIEEGVGARKTEGFVLGFNNSSSRLDQRFYNFLDSNNKIYLDWLGLSSGNKAYLNLFSLLRYELNKIREDNVIICIDEGDLYLHPKWQSDFFYQLINLVPRFKEASYQFVLTSHSPFLASDLPKQSIVFLSNNSENYSEEICNNNKIKTFGGNIGELYIDAFFMDGGLISRFAANKIQNLINKVKTGFTEKDEKIFDLLGDDFIKIQIENLKETYDKD
ncbi:AAA ATPase domain-containing protein [Tenacibaculum mesophilum]|uniref:Endonuclease GajA/Old nuclease/RecF-like AAA domain-containing protein n=1 Tax=Tenacibaculum mesophilum TaxID=104268 RepID=A0ABN5TC25_9FLAO|nr:AAA family ATPase [Tenacibaculum mesophilum]AZJ33799.1 hypothetical protein D6200_14985 [Tenacibaculum mesophilum]QFS29040.1 AAA family ATPase [Tenacibaculum mesophilum]SHF53485.1 AAA ATPase domain-containing protein [Tenacibaculum mesophilum]